MESPFDFKTTKELLHNSELYYIICTDNVGNYSYINNRYANTFSYINSNFVGNPYHITMHPEDKKVCEEVGGKCYVYPGKLFPATLRKSDGKGGYIFTKWEFTLIVEDGVPQGIFCLGYDITEHETVKSTISVINKDLEIKNQILDAIAYEQSHIVRAPLASIMGLVSILKTFDLGDEAGDIVRMLDTSSKQLDGVIREIVNKTDVETQNTKNKGS